MEQQAAVALLQRLDTLTQGLQRHYAKEGTASVEEPRLVSELSQLRLSELRQQCESAGVSEAHIDDAMESDSPKQAVAELLVRADSRSVGNRTPAQTAFAAAKRYEQGGPGHTEPFEAAREMLLQATAQHGAEQCVYYLLHNTEPKFGIARALMCLFRSMNLLILPVILHQYSDKRLIGRSRYFVAPSLAMEREESKLLCAHPMLLTLERTPLGQHILKSVSPADANADELRLRADVYLSSSKMKLADAVMQAIRPGLGASVGPAGAAHFIETIVLCNETI